MMNPEFEPKERLTRAQTWSALAWTMGPIGALWLALKIMTTYFPNENLLLLLVLAVTPEAAILFAVARWRTRKIV